MAHPNTRAGAPLLRRHRQAARVRHLNVPAFRRTTEQVSIEDSDCAKEDRIAAPDVTMKGILGVTDTAPPNENTGYYLDTSP